MAPTQTEFAIPTSIMLCTFSTFHYLTTAFSDHSFNRLSHINLPATNWTCQSCSLCNDKTCQLFLQCNKKCKFAPQWDNDMQPGTFHGHIITQSFPLRTASTNVAMHNLLFYTANWRAEWKNRIYWYISFFHPSLNRDLFPMFCLLVEGECQILVF